jgi:hypothetical protein
MRGRVVVELPPGWWSFRPSQEDAGRAEAELLKALPPPFEEIDRERWEEHWRGYAGLMRLAEVELCGAGAAVHEESGGLVVASMVLARYGDAEGAEQRVIDEAGESADTVWLETADLPAGRTLRITSLAPAPSPLGEALTLQVRYVVLHETGPWSLELSSPSVALADDLMDVFDGIAGSLSLPGPVLGDLSAFV